MSRASRLRTRPLPGQDVATAIRATSAVGAGDNPPELRARRLSGHDVVLGGAFDLADENTVALAPLVAVRARSSSVRDAVDDVRDAIDGLTAVFARILAEVDAQLRTSELAYAEAATARRALLQLHAARGCVRSPRPTSPTGPGPRHSSPTFARTAPRWPTCCAERSRPARPGSPPAVASRCSNRCARSTAPSPRSPGRSTPPATPVHHRAARLVAAAEARKDAEARATLLRLGIDPDSAEPAP